MSSDKVAIPSLASISTPFPSVSSFPSVPSPKVSNIPKPAAKPPVKLTVVAPIITKTTVDIVEEMEDKSLHDITRSNVENELLQAGYIVINKIVVRSENGIKKLQYIKATNNKGQKVYILIDIASYMSPHPKDLIIREYNGSNTLPYSLKNGAYNNAVKDVTGVAFEYGSNSICTLIMDPTDLSIKETNYIFNEHKSVEDSYHHIITYPIIRLTEIKVNPKIILDNTHTVINRLRNAEEIYERTELIAQNDAIIKLNDAFNDFGKLCDDVAERLYDDLNKLEDWNEVYLHDPPHEDEYKERFGKLQLNLIKRNEDVVNLIRIMKKVTNERKKIEMITKDINDLILFCQKEYADILI